MTIVVDDKKKISEIQNEFRLLFPFLRVEFFNSSSNIKERFASRNKISETNKTLGDYSKKKFTEPVIINGSTTVERLEKEIGERFGIHVQVFRKSGKSWLETTVTDTWTLQMQNEQGKELSMP